MRKIFLIGFLAIIGNGVLSNLFAQELDVVDIGKVFNKNIPLNLSEIATGIDYIPLEFTEDCALGDIYNILIHGDNILLLSEKQVYLFDRQGKFKQQIGRIGEGPGEYRWARDIFIHPDRNSIFVLDITGMQILEYNFKGTFLNTIKLARRQYSEQLFLIDDQFFMVSTRPPNDGDFIYSMDRNGSYLKGLPVTVEARESALHGGFQESVGVMFADDYFDLATAWNDTIFRFTHSGEKLALYRLDYGKYKYPLEGEKGSLSRQPPKPGYAFQHWRAITKNYLFITSQDGRNLKLQVYDRELKQIIHSSNIQDEANGGIRNDLDGGPGIGFIPSYQKNWGHDVIKCHSAIDMIEEFDSEQLKTIVGQLSEEDNPVVQIIHLK